MFLEDLVSDRDSEVSNLCSFLGVDPTPLLDGRCLKAENTLQERRAPRSLVAYLVATGFQRLLPKGVRNNLLKSPLFSVSQASILEAAWPNDALDQFVKEVGDNVKEFLRSYGKNEHFYDLSLAKRSQRGTS